MELVFLRFLNKGWVIWILETRLVSWVLGLFIPWLEVNTELPAPGSARFIFLLSFASKPKELTAPSVNTTLLAAKLANQYPSAKVIGCEFRNNPQESDEWGEKLKLLPKDRSFYAGRASNTIDERELLVAMALTFAENIDNSIIVSNGGHIRRASMVWVHYHPDNNLCFRSTSAKKDNDLGNPMAAQRRWQTWILANLVGIPFYKILGVEHFTKKNLSQPT